MTRYYRFGVMIAWAQLEYLEQRSPENPFPAMDTPSEIIQKNLIKVGLSDRYYYPAKAYFFYSMCMYWVECMIVLFQEVFLSRK